MNDTQLIVGLGNVGAQYSLHKHNVGFMLVDFLANQLNLTFKQKFKGFYAEFKSDTGLVYLLKPATFMNKSAESVQPFMDFFKITPQRLLVIHDELELPSDVIKFKQGGGNAGHNGLKSISGAIGPDYYRLRYGIGRPNHGSVADYVLSNFTPSSLQMVEKTAQAFYNQHNVILQHLHQHTLHQYTL